MPDGCLAPDFLCLTLLFCVYLTHWQAEAGRAKLQAALEAAEHQQHASQKLLDEERQAHAEEFQAFKLQFTEVGQVLHQQVEELQVTLDNEQQQRAEALKQMQDAKQQVMELERRLQEERTAREAQDANVAAMQAGFVGKDKDMNK